MVSIIDRLRRYVSSEMSSEEELAVDEYVLERRDPDPNPRVRTYDDQVSPEEVASDADLPEGTYQLQEIKENGMAGDVVWAEEIVPANEPD